MSMPRAGPPSDAVGTLTERDIHGLVVTAETYGVQLDQLAALLRLTEERARGVGARWRARGYADTARLGPGKSWHWLTRTGLAACGLTYTFAPPTLSRLAVSIMRELLTPTGDYGCPAAERLQPTAPPPACPCALSVLRRPA